jgi:glycerol-3-phosphate dehydrogenase
MIERRTLATIAPQMIRPMPFALPLYASLTRGMTAMRAGFLLDRLVAFDRNQGVAATHQLPAGRVVSGDELRRFPGLPDRNVTGAAVWYDYVTTEADRLTFSFALAAIENGAVLANHVEATAFSVAGDRVVGIRARDVLGARDFEIGARVTVNATGGGADRLLAPLGVATGIPMLKAMNLVTRREAGEAALGGRSASGRNLFLVPWRGRALFGTWESATPCRPDDAGVTAADVAAFIRELNEAFPSLHLTGDDVTLVHRGIVPGVVTRGGVALEGHEQVRDHGKSGGGNLRGLVSVVGAKYTTARRVAERVTDGLFPMLERPLAACRTATTVLPGGAREMTGTLEKGRQDGVTAAPGETVPHLIAAYGSRYRDVLGLAAGRPELTRRLCDSSPVVGAELVWGARYEMVGTLADAVVRRTPLGALGYPGDSAVDQAADLVGGELGWSADRRRAEIAALRDFYALIPTLAGTPSA